jgi:hypothetical protein
MPQTKGDPVRIHVPLSNVGTRQTLALVLALVTMLWAGAHEAAASPTPGKISADFDGDGTMDLAIGMPSKDVDGVAEAGAVYVIYGSASLGLDTTASGAHPGSQFWHQNRCVVPAYVGCERMLAGDGAEVDDHFGAALTTGDYNGDGFADLAVGTPGEDAGAVGDAGAVHVIYGSAAGLGAGVPDQVWDQDSAGVPDSAEDGDAFGASLASGNLGGGAQADLAIGIPFEDVGNAEDAGAWGVLYGSPGGLTATGSQFWTQDSALVADEVEPADRVGLAVAVGDFGKGSEADLAVGVPFEQSVGGIADAGAVHVLYGTAAGLSATGSQLWHQNSTDIGDSVEAFDFFGRALAAANIGKGDKADLVIGVPGEDLGAAPDAGAVNVIYGTANGLASTGNQLWHQDSSGVTDLAEAFDEFGSALAAADFGKSGEADLAVGVHGEDLGATPDAGAVSVLYGSASGLTYSGNQLWYQDRLPYSDPSEQGDEFGSSVAAWNFGRSAAADLAVGSPNEDQPGLPDAGALNVVYGTSTGLSGTDSQFFTELDVNFPQEPDGRFAEALPASRALPAAP